MAQSDIIQKLCDLIDDERIAEDEEFKKQNDEASKLFELLQKFINADKELYNIFSKYYIQDGRRESIEKDLYYREGFLCGARLMLEICGFENKNR